MSTPIQEPKPSKQKKKKQKSKPQVPVFEFDYLEQTYEETKSDLSKTAPGTPWGEEDLP